MYRVVTKRFDHRDRWIIEAGPWHTSRNDAEHWAEILRGLGYNAQIEGMHGQIADGYDNSALSDALASMA